jgi:peptide-methionine (R)-S-oxide reductase
MKKLMIILLATSLTGLFGCENSNGQNKEPKGPNGKTSAEWKKVLTPDQFYIMVNNHEKGVYVSAATGDVLFSSDDKFESGTGWPSFTKPIAGNKIAVIRDADGDRMEVVEKSTGLHLGHVFDDGPEDRGGKRFCMNSGALKFVKKK